MKSDIIDLIKLAVAFLPFILFAFLNSKANTKKEVRYRQYPMPVLALIYSAVLMIFMSKLSTLLMDLVDMLVDLTAKFKLYFIGNWIRDLVNTWAVALELVLFNTIALVAYIIIKRIITAILNKVEVNRDSFVGKVVGIFYTYDELEEKWFIKNHYGQSRTFIKAVYYGGCLISAAILFISYDLCMKHAISEPFYPVFPVIIIGEMAFFIDGLRANERKSDLRVEADKSRHVAMYPLLRKPLRELFGDKLAAEGTTVNNGGSVGGAIEDILTGLEQTGGHVGKNYSAFIRKKMEGGLKPNVDYVRCGYDLATGKSLLFNTPFYDKLNPYVFYAMHRQMITGGKVLIVLGRHGTEEDLLRWTEAGMQGVSNIPGLWKTEVLSGKPVNEENLPDIGIISRSGVHDLDIHKCNLAFLRKVSFVVVVEPSRLVTTAQIGLNLLIKCCGVERKITYCSVDRNCDGLVDALSHILMTNITEVSATEYPHGMSSYMYWTADDDYLQHRILPGVSRFLGMGTELSMVALRNQVKKTVWYGGEAFPVQDARWIAKQYYYDLLEYAQRPANQETFDKVFQTSFNMCDERVSDYSFITVEDDRNNLFETRRNFATIAEQQGFINVISSEYMLREYMASNPELFTADAKAIPYVTADYARTKRNAILSLCLLLCIDSVQEDVLNRQMVMLNIDTHDPVTEIWKEICTIFGDGNTTDKKGDPILKVKTPEGKTVCFEKDTTLLFKREYSVESGKFESVYTIDNKDFSRIILDDLQNAAYIAEQESKDVYLGTELKGHVYQKYMPGQFFTLNGKYYEMVSTTTNNRILVRRASEHIGGRLAYRQVRNYTIHHLEDAVAMGALKTVNNIDIHYQYASFSVDTPGYWKLRAYNDFDNGDCVKVNGVPTRSYHHKQVLKLDFSKLGDQFTDSVRMTLTNLLNEIFVTLFADNQPFISAMTPGTYDAPLTYSLELEEGLENAQKCIFIIEDSQLDIGLLVAVERNVHRILQIISDYLSWNDEMIAESIRLANAPKEEPEKPAFNVYDEDKPAKKKGFFGRIGDWFKGLFKRKNKKPKDGAAEGEKPEKKGFFGRIFGKKKKEAPEVPAQDYMMIYGKPHKLVKGKWVACSQEEFDKKMAERHQAIEEKEQAEKEAKEAEKQAEQEAQQQADSEETTEEETPAEETADEQATEAEPAEDAPAHLTDPEAPVTEEPPKELSKKERKLAAKAEKKAAKEQKKQAKAEAKAARKAEKERAKLAKKGLIPADEEPAAQTPTEETLPTEETVEETAVQTGGETLEETVEEAREQEEGEVSEDA